MKIGALRINFRVLLLKFVFIISSLIPNAFNFRQIKYESNLSTALEICEEIKNFGKENFSVFDELRTNPVEKDISIFITNKDCLFSDNNRILDEYPRYSCYCEKNELNEMKIKIIKNTKLLKEFNFNLSETFDNSDLDIKKIEPYTASLRVKRHDGNSTDDSNKKFNLDLTQNKLNIKREKLFEDESIDIDQLKRERIKRSLLVSIFVFSMSIFCIVLIKSALDCANNSKAAVNKMKENNSRIIIEKIKKRDIYSIHGTTIFD